jgi:hypothetical protein
VHIRETWHVYIRQRVQFNRGQRVQHLEQKFEFKCLF